MKQRDEHGTEWDVIDFHMVDRKKRRVELGDWRSDGRAFVANGQVRIYRFGQAAYRTPTPKTLANEFVNSRAPEAVPAESWGKLHGV
jgi:hypothetical protein